MNELKIRLAPESGMAAAWRWDNARLIGQLAQFGESDELLRMREADKQKKAAEKAMQPPRRRVRLPRAKPKGRSRSSIIARDLRLRLDGGGGSPPHCLGLKAKGE